MYEQLLDKTNDSGIEPREDSKQPWHPPSYKQVFIVHSMGNAPVICVSGPLGAGDTREIAGLKCLDLTADESRQCRRCAGVLISR